MRLTANEIQNISEVFVQNLPKTHVELRLFGSRVKENSKGGDIDLLLIAFDAKFYSEIVEKKYLIQAELKEKLGDQKIDLVIVKQEQITLDPFLKLIFPGSIVIYTQF